jgi:hypothetical protein
MTRRERLVIIAVAALTGIVILLQVNKPEPRTWLQRFERDGRQPFDVSVLQMYLKNVRNQEVDLVDSSFYELGSLHRQPTASSWITITSWLEMDSLSRHAFLAYMQNGGTAFVAATELDADLADTLGIETEDIVSISDLVSTDTVDHLPYARIIAYDTAQCTVLARADDTSIVCIRQRVGRGTLVFCSAPVHLTNYALLYSLRQIPSWSIIHSIPRGRIAFDTQYTPYHEEHIGPLHMLIAHPALRWAYWLCGIAAVLGVLVYGRRRQRAIPVIEPPKNASKEFALTVSSLYFNAHNNADLVKKLERLFIDHCKTTRGIDPDVKQNLTSMFDTLRQRQTVSDPELLALHQHMTTLLATGRT